MPTLLMPLPTSVERPRNELWARWRRGGIYRFAQDCTGTYGQALDMMHITTLNETHYEEEPQDLGFDPAPRRSVLSHDLCYVTQHSSAASRLSFHQSGNKVLLVTALIDDLCFLIDTSMSLLAQVMRSPRGRPQQASDAIACSAHI